MCSATLSQTIHYHGLNFLCYVLKTPTWISAPTPACSFFGDGAFSVAASSRWICLPAESLDAASGVTFKSSFKPCRPEFLLNGSFLAITATIIFYSLCYLFFFPSSVESFCPLKGTIWMQDVIIIISYLFFFAFYSMVHRKHFIGEWLMKMICLCTFWGQCFHLIVLYLFLQPDILKSWWKDTHRNEGKFMNKEIRIQN